jgi:endonuclease/exonuclease/phosphatase family metal-dependent hydrolase
VIALVAFAYSILAAFSPSLAAEESPTAQPERMQLRVLTLNMYGLRYPPRLGWMADQSDCAGRFRAVGQQIRSADPPYDMIAIQELYRVSDLHIVTCDPAPFLDALKLKGTGAGFGGSHSILFSPKGQAWKLEADGGIGFVTPHFIQESEALRFTGSGGSFLAARGVLYARITLSNSHVEVDVYVVHLSPGRRNAEQRKREIEALAKLIAVKSSTRGNPIIVLGDFNIAAPPNAGSEYATIRSLLGGPRDLWLEDGPTGPGYTYDCFGNAVAALRGCDYQARIDYIWIVNNRGVGDYEVKVSKAGSVRRVEWHTDRPQALPVSDHYGVEAFLSIERKNSPPPTAGALHAGTGKRPASALPPRASSGTGEHP